MNTLDVLKLELAATTGWCRRWAMNTLDVKTFLTFIPFDVFMARALALALPGEWNTLVAAVIVTQTLVELIGELFYIRLVPKMILPDTLEVT